MRQTSSCRGDQFSDFLDTYHFKAQLSLVGDELRLALQYFKPETEEVPVLWQTNVIN